MATAKEQLIDWGGPLVVGAFLCEQPHHWLAVWALIAINIVSRQVCVVREALDATGGELAELRREVASLRRSGERG